MTKEMGLEALNTIRDTTGDQQITKRLVYFYQNFPKDTADQRTTEFLKKLPFIKKFRLNDTYGSIYLEDFSNRIERILVDTAKPLKPISFEECTRLANESRIRFENYLKNGDCFMISEEALTHFPAVKAARDLPKMVQVLSDQSKSIDDKKEILTSLRVIPKRSKRAEIFIQNFVHSDKLKTKLQEHIELIIKKYGGTILNDTSATRGRKSRR